MAPKILAFGEIIWDVYPDRKLIGGAGLNFAAHCAKCGCESYMLSSVGNDELGDNVFDIARGFGVKTEFIKTCDKATGRCIVTLNDAKIPSYNVLRDAAYDNIVLCDEDIGDIKAIGFDAIYFGTLIQRAPLSRGSLLRLLKICDFKEKVCDVNLRTDCFDKDSVRLCLENATVLKISDEEEPTLSALGLYSANDNTPESIASAISASFPHIKYVIITCGSRGAYVYVTKEERGFFRESEKVKVASTVGAGDSFIAAWTASMLSGSTPEKAAERAVKLSGYVVSKTDAIPDYSFNDIIKP